MSENDIVLPVPPQTVADKYCNPLICSCIMP